MNSQFPKETDKWRLTGEVQPVGVLCCVELHNTSLVSVVALLNLSACHGARGAGINLMMTAHTKHLFFKQISAEIRHQILFASVLFN